MQIKLATALVVIVVAIIRSSSGLRCLECFGVSTEEECTSQGKVRECRPNEDGCEIEHRRHEGWGGTLKIFKHCKESKACDNNHIQNPRSAWLPSQCNPDSINSVCRCCCYEDMCNVAKEDCFGQPGCARLPTSIYQGSISCTDGRNYGSNCTVTCDPYMKMIGVDTTFCQSEGLWSDPIPRCENIQCPILQHLSNGWFMCTNSHYSGSVCIANCHPGYLLVGPEKRTCLDDESWDVDEEPICQSLNCPTRNPVTGGVVECTDGDKRQSRCKIQCDANRIGVGAMENYCQDNGEWSHPLPTCELGECPFRGDIRNGYVSCNDGVEIGSACQAGCDKGFALDGPAGSVCLATGHWSEDLPRCIHVICPARGHIVNGDVSCSDFVNIGSVCTVDCNVGFAVIGSQVSECLSSAEWSAPLPFCRRMVCPDRGEVDNGVVFCTNERNIGSTCRARCHVGSRLVGVVKSTCLPIGDWSNPLPTCEKIVCPDLDYSLQPGSMACTNFFFHRSTCSFTCNAGYRLAGASRLSCRRNGRWSTRMPECRLIRCGPQGKIANGAVTCSDGSSVGSDCDALCNEGFRPVGLSSSRCLPDGEWNRRLPVCRLIKCPVRGLIAGGSVTCTNDNLYKSICTASCLRGHQLIGESFSQCLSNGKWDLPLPKCPPQSCRDQGDLEHGSITCTDDDNVKSICRFQCKKEGYILYPKGTKKNICQPNQRWSTPKPCCARKCPPYAVMDVVIVLDSSSSIGIDNWGFLTKFVRGIIRSFIIAPDAANFAVFRYNRRVDKDTQIFLNSYPGDVDGLVKAFGRIPYDGTGTFTGSGLRHALEVSLAAANGNRPDVKDVVFVITDGRAADDVKTPSAALRATGATVLVLGIESPRGELDFTQLEEIAGHPQNVVVATGGFAGLDTTFSLKLSSAICGKPC